MHQVKAPQLNLFNVCKLLVYDQGLHIVSIFYKRCKTLAYVVDLHCRADTITQ